MSAIVLFARFGASFVAFLAASALFLFALSALPYIWQRHGIDELGLMPFIAAMTFMAGLAVGALGYSLWPSNWRL